jgi:hypothetical protein
VIPEAEKFSAVAPVRLVPVIVNARLVAPWFPEVGETEVSFGGATTVYGRELVVPFAVTTVMLWDPFAAVLVAIAKLAVISLSSSTAKSGDVVVIPFPLTVTFVVSESW